MNRLTSALKGALQIAIFGIVLAVSKRKAKWLFWPLYFFATWAILPLRWSALAGQILNSNIVGNVLLMRGFGGDLKL